MPGKAALSYGIEGSLRFSRAMGTWARWRAGKIQRSCHEVATKLLRSCDEVALDSYEVATKFLRNDPSRIPCASPASPHQKESTKGAGRRRRPPPFVEAARSAASFMDGCGEAGEAQGILNGSFRKNFAATS